MKQMSLHVYYYDLLLTCNIGESRNGVLYYNGLKQEYVLWNKRHLLSNYVLIMPQYDINLRG